MLLGNWLLQWMLIVKLGHSCLHRSSVSAGNMLEPAQQTIAERDTFFWKTENCNNNHNIQLLFVQKMNRDPFLLQY